ncbi:MAG: hypothetical protein HY033_00455 [Ignavibacteriae bacterium]|nr:hypothetical protein [Ignavibacteria bacterium]MBI3363359.1 hypothetical protein [Ignavibacteriota bacterium]
MDSYLSIFVSALFTLLVGWILRFVIPKSRLVWWVSHDFQFILPPPGGSDPSIQPFPLKTHALTIQNIGTEIAHGIEIAHRTKPDLFKLNPERIYSEPPIPSGEHLLTIPSIAPGEFITIEFLSYGVYPQLLYVRSDWGHARKIDIQPQQVMPKWAARIYQILLYAGIYFVAYWVIRIILYFYGHL